MITITEAEFKTNIDAIFERAIDLPVKIEDGNHFLYLTSIDHINIIDNEWVKNFMTIPEEYRVNPFETCDTGDLYWADKRNVNEFKDKFDNLKL